MFAFAYDASINGDWISHYAIRLASHYEDKTLRLIHVLDGRTSAEDLDSKLRRIDLECRRADVLPEIRLVPPKRTVLDSLCSAVPPGPESYVVCGTRVRARRRALFGGTVAEQLLRTGLWNVLAIRVVQPGLLGVPRNVLLPVSGHPRGFRSGIPFLRLFAPDVSNLHILFVERISRWRYRVLSHHAADRLAKRGRGYVERVEREINHQLGLGTAVADVAVTISDDVPKEILTFANRVQSRLIYMGASERTLRERFLYSGPIEQVLRHTSCDVAIYRGVE